MLPLSYDLEVDLVQIPIRITDKKGDWVSGIKPEELELFEDGKRQEILYLDEVRIQGSTQPVFDTSSAVTEYTRLLAETQNSILIVVDGCTSGKIGVEKQKKFLQEFLQKEIPNAAYAMILIPPAGGYKLIQDFTNDPNQVSASIEKIQGSNAGLEDRKGKAATLANTDRIQECAALRAFGMSALNCLESAMMSVVQTANLFAHEEEARSMNTIRLLEKIFEVASHLPGQKNVILISEGMDPAGAFYVNYAVNVIDHVITRYALPENLRRRIYSQVRVDSNRTGTMLEKIRELVKFANGSGLTVYWVNPEYGKKEHDISAEMSEAGNFPGKFVNAPDIHLAMAAIAEDTGGAALSSTNTGKFYEQISDNIPRYYVISYKPKRAPNDNQFHKIEVKTRNDKYRIAYRKEFKDLDQESIRQELLATAHDFPEEPQLGLKTDVQYFLTSENRYHVMIRAGLPYDQIQPRVAGNNVEDDIHFAFLIRDQKGIIQLNTHPVVKVRGKYEEFVGHQDREAVLEYFQSCNLKPGSYEMSIVALDSNQNSKTTSKSNLVLPDGSSTCPVVSPILLASSSAKSDKIAASPTPNEKGEILYGDQILRFATTRAFPPQGSLTGFYQIYNSTPPSIYISFKLYRETTFLNQTTEHELKSYTDPQRKLISNFFSLPYKGLTEGTYEIEINVRGSNGCMANARAPFNVTAPPHE